MDLGEKIRDIISRENRDKDFEREIDSDINSLKSRLGRGERPEEQVEKVLSEEERLERELLDLEKELFDLLSFEDEEIETVLDSSREFLNWKARSLKEIENCLKPLKGIDQGLEHVLSSVENPGASESIDLYQVGWDEVVDGSEQIFEIFEQVKQEERKIFEDLSDMQEDSARFLENIKQERQALNNIEDLVKHFKSEQGELEDLQFIKESPELNRKLGEEEERLSKLVENLVDIEEINEKLGEIAEERKEFTEEVNETDLSELKELYPLINNEYEDITSRVEKLDEMNERNYFTNQEQLAKQLELVKESVNMLEKYINGRYDLEVNQKGVSRRSLVKGIGTLLGGWTAADTAINIYRQTSTGQFEFMNPEAIGGFDPAIENSLNQDTTEVHVFNIFFEKGGKKYNGEKISKQVEKSINSLQGVNFNVNWHNLRPSLETYLESTVYSDGYTREDIPDQNLEAWRQRALEFEELIKNTTVVADDTGEQKVDYEQRVEQVEEHINNYFSENFREVFGYEKIKIILADFKMQKASGASFNGNLKSDVIFTARFDNQTQVINTITHELGHKLSLPHTVSPDIMSYSITSQALEKYFEVPFGPESRANWDKVRKTHKQ